MNPLLSTCEPYPDLRLTPAKLKTLGIIIAAPFPMTIREVADARGVTINAVAEPLEHLAKNGLINFTRGKARTIFATCRVEVIQ